MGYLVVWIITSWVLYILWILDLFRIWCWWGSFLNLWAAILACWHFSLHYVQGSFQLSLLLDSVYLVLCWGPWSTWSWALWGLINGILLAFFCMQTSSWTSIICWGCFLFSIVWFCFFFFGKKPSVCTCVGLFLGVNVIK